MEAGSQSTRPLEVNVNIINRAAEDKVRDSLPHPCQLCNQSFSAIPLLKRHLKRCHTEVIKQPHPCFACPKAYAYEYELKQHVQHAHSKDKPFQSQKCNYKCKSKCNLMRHLKSHEKNSESLKCRKYDETVDSKSGLKKNLKTVDDSVKNEEKTGNDYSQDISKTCGNEKHNHGEASGGLVEASPGDILGGIHPNVQDGHATVDHSTTGPQPGSEFTESGVQVALWGCYCGNIYFSHDELESHWDEDHKPAGRILEPGTVNVSGDYNQGLSSSFSSAQEVFLTATNPTTGSNNAESSFYPK